jgi:NTE family protein
MYRHYRHSISIMNKIDIKEDKNNKIENVLVLQGGGSLGAFGCGVFKAIANNDIKIDIIAGTSIGGVNAAITAGSKDEKHPEKILEQFWLELSEGFVGFVDLDKANLSTVFRSMPDFVEKLIVPSIYSYFYNYDLPSGSSGPKKNNTTSTINANECGYKEKAATFFFQFCNFWK